jgi:hypothetical protein
MTRRELGNDLGHSLRVAPKRVYLTTGDRAQISAPADGTNEQIA